jgi:hypothetical protein
LLRTTNKLRRLEPETYTPTSASFAILPKMFGPNEMVGVVSTVSQSLIKHQSGLDTNDGVNVHL